MVYMDISYENGRITWGDGSCVVADVSPTATQVDKERDDASILAKGATSDNLISDCDRCSDAWVG